MTFELLVYLKNFLLETFDIFGSAILVMMTSLLLARVFLPAITKIRAPKIGRIRSLSMTQLVRHIQKCIREPDRTTELPIQTASVRVPKRDDHVGPCHAFGLFTIHSVDNVTVDQTFCVDLFESTTSFHQQDISDGSRYFCILTPYH